DELALPLLLKIRDETAAAARARGADPDGHPAYAVLEVMVGWFGRGGRAAGRGFYEYDAGSRAGLWPGLGELFPEADPQPPLVDLKERMLFSEALEAVRCLDEG